MTTKLYVSALIGDELEDEIAKWKDDKNATIHPDSVCWNTDNSEILEIMYEEDAVEFSLRFDVQSTRLLNE